MHLMSLSTLGKNPPRVPAGLDTGIGSLSLDTSPRIKPPTRQTTNGTSRWPHAGTPAIHLCGGIDSCLFSSAVSKKNKWWVLSCPFSFMGCLFRGFDLLVFFAGKIAQSLRLPATNNVSGVRSGRCFPSQALEGLVLRNNMFRKVSVDVKAVAE